MPRAIRPGRPMSAALAPGAAPAAFAGPPPAAALPAVALPALLRADFGGEQGLGERRLLDFARRATAPGWAGLVVLFHRFPAPGAGAHHRRVARALLDDAAQRHGGQVFALRNLDLVLLCPQAALRTSVTMRPLTPPARGTPPGMSPGETLPELLLRLLGAETQGAVAPLALWSLPEQQDRLLAYATGRMNECGLTPVDRAIARADPPGSTADATTRLLPDLLLRQTAILLGPAAPGSVSLRLRPLFREITAADALQAEAGTHPFAADPFVLRHFAARLQARVLAALPAEAMHGDRLDPLAGTRALHLNLAPDSVATDAFAAVAALCRARGIGLGVEINLADAGADPESYAAARAILAAGGITCAIDHVSLLALRLARPATLAPDLVKLEWTPRLSRLSAPEHEALEGDLRGIGPERLLLMGADGEAALQWGLTHGIRRFQGRHVDIMLAASRLAGCPHAGDCTMRQCAERASATAPAGRASCRNTALLDAATPGEHTA